MHGAMREGREPAVVIDAQEIQETYPLSPLQEGMLFHRLMNEAQDTYVLSTLFELASRTDAAKLVSAIQKVIDRHELLRCSISWDGLPRPVHLIHRRATLPVEWLELDGGCDPDDRIAQLMRPTHCYMDLRQAPLLRLHIVARPDEALCHAVLQVHHIICDHQSLRMMVAEIMNCLDGKEHTLLPPTSIRDYVSEGFAPHPTASVETFFRSKLGDVEEPTAPFGVLDVHGDGDAMREATRRLSSVLTQRVRARSWQARVSAGRLLHAAWGLVVAHTSGRDDVIFGTVLLMTRRTDEQRRPFGMAVNTLPLRLRMRGVTAAGLVELAWHELTDVLGYAQTPLVAAQQCSAIEDGAPLFTTLLNFRHSGPVQDQGAAEVSGIRVLGRADAWTNYPITVTVDDFGDHIALTAHTDQRIDPERVVAYLETAIESLMYALEFAPERPALSLNVLPEAEREAVLSLFNETQAHYAGERLIHRLFEQQADRTPKARALEYRGISHSYAALNRTSNQLARYLIAKGVKPDEPVGLWVERSPEMIIAMLGILKAGAAYLPLDPSYPAERIHYMLQEAAPRVILSEQALAASLQDVSGELLWLRDTIRSLSDFSDRNITAAEVSVTPEDLLYVIYTSGSTGKPKGIAMPHRAMANLIQWHRQHFGSVDQSVVLQFAAVSFDVAFQEIFTTLCTGGTLVLLDEWVRTDAAALMKLLCERAIETLFMPPLMLQSLAQHFSSTSVAPEHLSNVVVAGEQLRITPQIVALFKRLPGCRLHNHYGPTETHVVTSLTLGADPDRWPTLPSIGRPISNTHIYILDTERRLVPIDVPGEIYVGGANVARGYLNRPELSAERFLRDPFRDAPQARLYKTGDQGRWRADGTIEYLGRNDDQVKIRGYRIELGEIEAQLANHEAVKQAAVIVRDDLAAARALVAYVTPREGHQLATSQLRAHLKGRVPEYMVPAAFVLMEHLPVTASGKLSRRALPAPQRGDYSLRSYEPPQGDTEQALTKIWSDLLYGQEIGRHDNFFSLGGHSLLAMQVVTRVQSMFAVQMPMRAMFERPTVEQLALRIDELRRARLLEQIAAGGNIEELLQAVSALPESMVAELMRELAAEGQR
jgi:amino acid adenylation domain-containing protein